VTATGSHSTHNDRVIADDPIRLRAVGKLEAQLIAGDADMRRLVHLAVSAVAVEFAGIYLVPSDRLALVASAGAAPILSPKLALDLCRHVVGLTAEEGLVVDELEKDVRFFSIEDVNTPNGLFAGVPINFGGQAVGAFVVCAARTAGKFGPTQVSQLVDLAALASSYLQLQDEARVRAKTAAALLKEEWRHALTLEAGKVGSWVWDRRTDEVTCNDTFRRMFGLPENGRVRVQEVVAKTQEVQLEPLREAMRASFRQGVDFNAEAKIEGTETWVNMRGRVYQREASGKPLLMMGVCTDVSDSKRNAEQMRNLLRELNHRVKNTLAMIQSLARQTGRRTADPDAFIDAFSGRLRTISDVHVLLAERDWGGICMVELVESQLGPEYAAQPDIFTVSGDRIVLPADHALGLAMILHELTTNAQKHGALSQTAGRLKLVWKAVHEPRPGVQVIWEERSPMPIAKPNDRGLGLVLIERSLAKVLESTVDLDFKRTGVVANIWLPGEFGNGSAKAAIH
jgi:two-component sensor histidine kinase/putative methionine-R-sulfoxide reductase with GAF domain